MYMSALCGQLRKNLGVNCVTVVTNDVLEKVDGGELPGICIQGFMTPYPAMGRMLFDRYSEKGEYHISGG